MTTLVQKSILSPEVILEPPRYEVLGTSTRNDRVVILVFNKLLIAVLTLRKLVPNWKRATLLSMER